MAPHIVPIAESIPHVNYVEPFAGGAAIFFAKRPVKMECLNGINGHLINFYKCLIDTPCQLIAEIDRYLYSRADYTYCTNLANYDGRTAIQQAAMSYVSCMQSIGHRLHSTSSWQISMKDGGSKAQTYQRRKAQLQRCADRLKDVYIENVDALELIKRWDSPETLFYIDPPLFRG